MKKFFSTLLISSLLIVSTSFAADTVKPFVVNPTTMRGQLFSKNITLLQALNNVQASKNNVTMARAKLLPSINLAVLLPALANPTFLLASVTFLFPFLVPSNWAVLKQEKELFESDKASYKSLQLNILSNALSLYYTYVNDQKVQQIYVEQSKVLQTIYENLKVRSEILGDVGSDDLAMAQAQWDEAKIRSSKLAELLGEELSALRTLLGLPLGTNLTVEDADLPASGYETKSALEIADHSLEVAPEAVQLQYLVKAAKAGKWAKVFGFMSSASVAGTASSSGSAFGQLKSGGAFSFGADNLVNIKIANNNIESINLRQEQLKQEGEKTAEIVVGSMVEVKEQQDLSQSSLDNRMKVYDGQKVQFELGLISLQTLLQTQSQLTDSKVNVLKTDLDLKMQRLTLQRLVIDGDFALVKGCSAENPAESKGIFHRNKEKSLDEICQAQ